MLSLQLLRENPEEVKAALARRGEEAPVEEILEMDKARRSLLTEVEALRARRREMSRKLGTMPEKPPSVIAELKGIAERVETLEKELDKIEARLNDLLLTLPNLPHPSLPEGKGAEGNVVVRTWGETRDFPFPPKPHWELGEALGIIDFKRGVKIAGSRFFVLKGQGARLERALISWMLDFHTQKHGYTEVSLPYMVKRQCMQGSGNLPRFAENLYHDEEDDLWLIPTAEVPLTGLHSDEILEPGTLPRYYVAYTACFRREKAAAGKDTRGIKRVHQFNKVELYKLVEPEKSFDELEKLVADAEDLCRALEIPYRVVLLCPGEIGFASAKSYDLEMWAPGCGEWLEVSSCSNCTDFQARRAGIRYRPARAAQAKFVHTLNGSGLALPRVVIAILENYQQEDGRIAIPTVLRPYLGKDTIP